MRSTENRQREAGPVDIGTLWTMHRVDHAARCALLAGRVGWSVRVLVDGDLLLEERCTQAAEAFTLAEQWRLRMVSQGWQQVVPPRHRTAVIDQRP
jgi:hypothetical protein